MLVQSLFQDTRKCTAGTLRKRGEYRLTVVRDEANGLLFHVKLLGRTDLLGAYIFEGYEVYQFAITFSDSLLRASDVSISMTGSAYNKITEDGLWSQNRNNVPFYDEDVIESVVDKIDGGMTEFLMGVLDNCLSISEQQDTSSALQSCLLISQRSRST